MLYYKVILHVLVFMLLTTSSIWTLFNDITQVVQRERERERERVRAGARARCACVCGGEGGYPPMKHTWQAHIND